jgi:hypothetical protein
MWKLLLLPSLLLLSPFAHAQSGLPFCKGLSTATKNDIIARGGKLPDLRTQPLTYFWIEQKNGKRTLRFGNGISNTGAGPFEVRPVNIGGTTYGVQRIYNTKTADEVGATVVFECQGSAYEYHSTHGHFHLAAMSKYLLYRTNGNSTGLGSSKVSFCLIDYYRRGVTGPRAYYKECDTGVQGISVDWVDYYRSTLPDQEIDITTLPDGRYWHLSNSAPQRNFLEQRTSNNHSWTLLEISRGGTRVRVLRNSTPE